eukprot:2107981-Prymnesium_polylepis.2
MDCRGPHVGVRMHSGSRTAARVPARDARPQPRGGRRPRHVHGRAFGAHARFDGTPTARRPTRMRAARSRFRQDQEEGAPPDHLRQGHGVRKGGRGRGLSGWATPQRPHRTPWLVAG